MWSSLYVRTVIGPPFAPATLLCTSVSALQHRPDPTSFAFRNRSARAWLRKSATRLCAITSDVFRSSCDDTPDEWRIDTCGIRPVSLSAAAARPGASRNAGEDDEAGEARDADEADGADPGEARTPAGGDASGPGRDAVVPRPGGRQEPLERGSRSAHDRERSEERHLGSELGAHRRDQERREQSDPCAVDDSRQSSLRRRLRVGDHEEHEDQDLGRGDQHPPEVAPGHGAEVPPRGHVVPASGDHGHARGEGQPEGDRDPDQLQPEEDREAAGDDDHERERHPRATSAPTRSRAAPPGPSRGSGSTARDRSWTG